MFWRALWGKNRACFESGKVKIKLILSAWLMNSPFVVHFLLQPKCCFLKKIRNSFIENSEKVICQITKCMLGTRKLFRNFMISKLATSFCQIKKLNQRAKNFMTSFRVIRNYCDFTFFTFWRKHRILDHSIEHLL